MINGRWLFLLLTFFSMSAIADVPTKNGTIPTSEVIDYDNATQIFASYFLNEKLATRFTNELLALPDDLQDSLLNLVVLSNDKFPSSTSARDKHTFAIWLLKAHQKIQENEDEATRLEVEGRATPRVESLLKKFPELSALLSERLLPRAKAADYYDTSYLLSPEKQAELQRLRAENAALEKKIAEDRKQIAEIKKETALIKANNEKLDKIKKMLGLGSSKPEELDKIETSSQSKDDNN